MHVLITGGAGFIGSSLADRLLVLGHKITILDEFNDFYSPEIKERNIAQIKDKVTVIRTSLCNKKEVNKAFEIGKFDLVVHLAARAGVRPSIEAPELYVNTNILGTLYILEACKKNGITKHIFASSSSVYGVNPKVPFSEEDALPKTISPYAATKLAGEHLCANFFHLWGISSICLRFFTVYGPRQRPDLAISKFINLIDQNKPIVQYGDGTTGRDYTYIDDIVFGIEKAIQYQETNHVFDIFNLGNSYPILLKDLILNIEKCMETKAQIEVAELQPGDVPRTWADISKAKKLLNYVPKTPIKEGLKKYVQWFEDSKK